MSVVGFDEIPEAEYFAPLLTTVRQDFDELGRRCVHQLLALLRGEETDGDGVVHPVLVNAVKHFVGQACEYPTHLVALSAEKLCVTNRCQRPGRGQAAGGRKKMRIDEQR